jgi:four helix bundle protein
MRPHKKLHVWNKAIEFVTKIYKATESFPKSEKFGLISQIRRSAVSIPSNIARPVK